MEGHADGLAFADLSLTDADKRAYHSAKNCPRNKEKTNEVI